jgi:hypothetical protein
MAGKVSLSPFNFCVEGGKHNGVLADLLRYDGRIDLWVFTSFSVGFYFIFCGPGVELTFF